MTHPDPVQSRLAVPDAALLALLGSRDESLRMAEDLLDADVHVRGNELTLTGTPADVAFAERVFTELITLAERGQQVSVDAVRAHRRDARRRLRSAGGPGRGAHAGHPVPPRPHHPAQDAEPEALRRRHRRAHDRLRHRPRGHRQDVPRDGQGRAGAAGQEGQPDHPHATRRRGGRAAGLPARHAVREDRPVPAPAVRRAARHDRPGVDPQAAWRRARSRSRRWPTCAAARSTTRSSSSTRRRTPRPSR